MNDTLRMVPQHYKGARSDTAFIIKKPSHALAEQLFEKAKENLLNVNNWQSLAGSGTAEFKVIGNDGKETNDLVKEGNYLRITIPVVPNSSAGGGYDWVQVEKIEEIKSPGYRYIGMRVRPGIPPFYKEREVAHFFSKDATSTFCIQRQGRKVKAAVYGRNEKPNTRVRNFFGKIRNAMVAIGAMIGLNKPQWKSLVKGWLLRQ